MRGFTITLIAFVVLILGASVAEADDSKNPYAELLKQHGIETGDDIRRYLAELHPGPDAREQVTALIQRLGDESFSEREQAMQELLRRPVVAADLLQQAAEGDDPEIGWRANHVLKHRELRSDQILHAAFHVVANRRLKGMAAQIVAAMPLCTETHVQMAAANALKATATKSDVGLLERLLHDGDVSIRVAACSTLEMLLGAASSEYLAPLLEDADERLRLEVAKALANHGDRKCLRALGKLLESEDVNIRSSGVHMLRALTGTRFGFVAYDDPPKSSGPAKAWQAWIEREGLTADLTFPIRDAGPRFGRTLICDRTTNTLVEMDAEGKEIWQTGVSRPYGCHALPNGHRLVASYTGRFVAEYSAAGEEIWKATLPSSAYSVRRLENGNTLVACYGNRKVIEIKPDKTTAWEMAFDDKPKDARRLENGNTLVCLYSTGRVVEVDRAGETVWQLAVGDRSYSAQRLSNGNTLVTQYTKSRAVEFDRDGREVWSKTGVGPMYDAQRLPNGNTLYVDSTGAHEAAPGKNVVWEHRGPGFRRAFRY